LLLSVLLLAVLIPILLLGALFGIGEH